MPDAPQLQIVAVLPGGQFFGLGLLALADVDILIALLASCDAPGGHLVSPIDVRRAYDQAQATQEAITAHRRAYGTDPNNDADDDNDPCAARTSAARSPTMVDAGYA